MNKVVLITIAVILILGVGAYAFLKLSPSHLPTPMATATPSSQSSAIPTAITNTQSQSVQGKIINVTSLSSRQGVSILQVKDPNQKVATIVEVDTKTQVTDENKEAVDYMYLQQGFEVTVSGTPSEGALYAKAVTVTDAPNIVVFTPKEETVLPSTFVVTGAARVFENVLAVRIKDSKSGKVYLQKTVMSDAPDVGKFGPFSLPVDLGSFVLEITKDQTAILEVYSNSAKDGIEINMVRIPLKLKP
jgi:hypothetical protein